MIKNRTNIKAHKYTILTVRLLEKLLGSNIKVEGIENIPPKPVLFVSNHFTRSETIIVPYIIYKSTKRQVRCLADRDLFGGILGRFLRSVGAISTKDKNRDQSIISDLVNGDSDWLIYPEGRMVKNKDNYEKNGKSGYFSFGMFSNKGENRVRTGSAVLALKSELYRNDLIKANQENQIDLLNYYKQKLNLEFSNKLKDLQTNIVPINITYYPIRPGKNIILKIFSKIFKQLPKQTAEELEIEGNLLLSSSINVSFGKAINLAEYVKNIRKAIYLVPLIDNETKINLILKSLKNRLTDRFMEDIYSRTQINLDHLVAAIIYFYPNNQININHFKVLIYVSVIDIIALNKYRINDIISEKNICRLFEDEYFEQFVSVIQLAKQLEIITENDSNKTYTTNKDKFEQKYDFQYIRLENTLKVILNEFSLLADAINIVKQNVLLSENWLQKRSFDNIFSKDLKDFTDDYNQYYDQNLSKDKAIGTPLFFNNINHKNRNLDGILLVHGYLSCPKQMEKMAQYFNNLGFKIYLTRLKGHGTAPINLEYIKWQDWYNNVSLDYEALKLICRRVFVVGFSTGGLLSLVLASKKQQIDGIICINPALKLRNLKAKFAFGVYLWNDLLEKLRISKGQLKYVENDSEYPDLNYSQNYVNGIEQLELLMDVCNDNLEKITCPTMIMQSNQDPIVDAKSSKLALNKIGSTIKQFQDIDSSKHTIVTGKDSNKVFVVIRDFLESRLELTKTNF